MTRTNEPESDGPPTPHARGELPEQLEHALYEIYFGEVPERCAARFEELLARHPDRADALRRAWHALARSANALGHLRDELDEAVAQGRQIGPFEIMRLLGEGGFGIVYEARQRQPVRRQVALKVLRQGHANQRSRRRFEAEQQLLARLQHANIAQVYDAGVTDEQQHYFAMEFVDGKPITNWCEQADVGVEERLRLFLQVCAAIHHAHQREIVHRDLKPSNVLVHEQDGLPVPKVIDFGIAKLIAAASEPVGDGSGPIKAEFDATRIGAQVGTPGYMSPEQASGEWVDTRTDVYSLGVLLCELLVGEQPLPREKLRSSSFVALARTLVEEPPRRPSKILAQSLAGERQPMQRQLLRRLREDLDWIVLRAVAPRREDRYTSVAALAEDIQRHLEGAPVLARQNTTGYVIRKFVRRHRLGVALAGAAGATLIAILIGLTWGLGVLESARNEAERGRDLAEVRGAAARTAVAQLALESGDFLTAGEFLASVPGEFRQWGWRHLASHLDNAEATFEVDNIYIEVMWLDDTRVLAFPRRGDITCFNVDTGAVEFTFAGWDDTFFEAVLAPERGLALVAGTRDVSLWSVTTGERIRTVHRVPAETLAIAWSQDRTLMACAGRGGWLDLVSIQLEDAVPHGLAAASDVASATRHRFDDSVSAIAFHGDDELLLGFIRGEVRRVAKRTGETLAAFHGHTDEVEHLLFDAARKRIYTASVDTTVRSWDLQDPDSHVELSTDVRARRLALSQGGDLLYSCGGWSVCRMQAWHTSTLTLAGRYSGHRRGAQGLALSPDGRRLVSTARDRTLRVWLGEPPRTVRRFDAGRDARVLSASPDGTRFGAVSLDGHVRVWNAHTLATELDLETGLPWTGSALHGDFIYIAGRTMRAVRISDGVVVAEGATNGHVVEPMLPVGEVDRLYGCHEGNVLVWRLADLELLHVREFDAAINRIAWDPVRRCPVIGDLRGRLYALDPIDGGSVAQLRSLESDGWDGALAYRGDLAVQGFASTLTFRRGDAQPRLLSVRNGAAAISPDTRRVATGGADNKVRLWDPDSGDQLLVFGGMPYNIAGLHFVDGGRRLVALSHRWRAPSYVYVWTAPDAVDLDR